MEKAALKKKKKSDQQIGLIFKEETSESLYLEHRFCMVLKIGHFGQYSRNTLKVLKCGAGEGWRSVVQIV